MEIYILEADLDEYQSFCFTKDADTEVAYKFDGRHIVHWEPVDVEVCKESRGSLPASDFPSLLLSHMPIFSQRAIDALSELLRPNGQLLPLGGDGTGYYAYNVTKLIDALDVRRSDLVRFSTGRIMDIRRYAFLREKIEAELAIFKLETTPNLRVFVTSTFIMAVQKAGLTGFSFRAAV